MPNTIPLPNQLTGAIPKETTKLSPIEEVLYKHWLTANQIKDSDEPDSFYDYRGYYKDTNGAHYDPAEHGPDTYKQHGHPTFSVESKYSLGPFDGGMWIGPNKDHFMPQMSPSPAHNQGAAGADPNKPAKAPTTPINSDLIHALLMKAAEMQPQHMDSHNQFMDSQLRKTLIERMLNKGSGDQGDPAASAPVSAPPPGPVPVR